MAGAKTIDTNLLSNKKSKMDFNINRDERYVLNKYWTGSTIPSVTIK